MRKFVALLVVVTVVLAAWFGGWFYGAGEINRAIANLAAGGGENAPRITCGRQSVTGFPFRFDITCEDAVLVAGDVTATLAGFKVSILAYNPTLAKFSALAPLTLSDAYSGAQSRIGFAAAEGSAHVTTDDLWAGLAGEGWRIQRVSVVADGVDWADTVVDETPVLKSSHIEAHLLDVPERHDAAAGTAVLASYVSLSDVIAPRYGIAGGEATLEAEVSGLPDDLRAFLAEDVADRWRDAGGTLKLVGLRGAAGEDFVETSGTLTLDSGDRLDGQVQVRSRGLVERLGDLIPPDWRTVLLGGQADDGSYAQTLTIKAGVVFVGLLPVAMIPPLI
ncbi:MAG TPA: DUF2125 domain-containing protein [Alphaproteobacteria bacterium]|nr:DUF2125 domain-containing protein [Alphaproteobacteria bacterium]